MVAAALLSTLVSLILAFAPLIPEISGAPVGERREWRSLVQREGLAAAGILAVPVLICIVPLLAGARLRRRFAIVAAGLLGLWVVLGALSVGPFYLPSLVLMVVAAVRLRPPARPRVG